MSLSISSSFYPYRLILKRKEPVELTVQLKNIGEKDKMVSLHAMSDRNLSFDKTGLKNTVMEKIDSLKPNENKKFVYEIFPKQFTAPGTCRLKLKVLEHYQNYKYSEKEYTKDIELVVTE